VYPRTLAQPRAGALGFVSNGDLANRADCARRCRGRRRTSATSKTTFPNSCCALVRSDPRAGTSAPHHSCTCENAAHSPSIERTCGEGREVCRSHNRPARRHLHGSASHGRANADQSGLETLEAQCTQGVEAGCDREGPENANGDNRPIASGRNLLRIVPLRPADSSRNCSRIQLLKPATAQGSFPNAGARFRTPARLPILW
jgi:hypothetical protein